jgi:hypothetical protein
MSDIATVRQAIVEEWKVDASGAADELLNRSLCQALVALRPMPFTFNVDTLSLDTVADQASYAKAPNLAGETANLLPWDFWGILGHQLSIDNGKGGTAATRSVLRETDPGALDREIWATEQSDTPTHYTIWNEKLWINPPPDSVDEITGRFIKNLGTPVPIYASGTWNYVNDLDDANIDKDTFTNDWFTRAFDVLVARVAMQYFGRFERNQKNQVAAAQAFNLALAELKAEAAPFTTAGSISPFMGNT